MNKEEIEARILKLQKELYYGTLFGDHKLVERCKTELKKLKEDKK